MPLPVPCCRRGAGFRPLGGDQGCKLLARKRLRAQQGLCRTFQGRAPIPQDAFRPIKGMPDEVAHVAIAAAVASLSSERG